MKTIDFNKFRFDIPILPIRGFESFPDGMASEAPDNYKKIFYHNGFSLHKVGRNFQPLLIYPVGNADAKGSASNFTRADVDEFAIHQAELFARVLLPECSARCNKHLHSVVAILDLKLLGLRQFYVPALLLLTGLIKIFELHYPESISVISIINAPGILYTSPAFIRLG